MKPLLSILLLCALTGHSNSQENQPAAAELTAVIFTQEGSQPAWITEASKAAIRYRESDVSTESLVLNRSQIEHIYLYEPREFTAATDLFVARKYEEAKSAFAAVKERYKSFSSLENSPSVLAAYYEMECMRRLGDLAGLGEALQNFDKSQLVSEHKLRQVDLYVLWMLLQNKNFEQLEKLASKRIETPVTPDHRTQLHYLLGAALEGLDRPDEAIRAYQTALVADAGASEDVTRQAALGILGILSERADVKRAIREWGGPQQRKNSPGYNKLLEASALAVQFETMLGAGAPLPEKLKDLTKYRPAPVKAGDGN